MRAFVGQTRSRRWIDLLTRARIGECTQRDEYPPRRVPWILDNGAFRDWTSGKPFDRLAWHASVVAARSHVIAPTFAVCPDLVARGWESLEFSHTHAPELRGLSPYLVTQDGMDEDLPRVERAVADAGYAGLFVGGSLEWKNSTAVRWVDVAHALGLPCHIGRVGNAKRVRWAREIGADSVDSCQPLWSERNLRRFISEVNDGPRQRDLFAGGST